MSILKSKKKRDEKKISLSDKLIDALNYVPTEYVHTPGYKMTSEEALKEARAEIAKISVPDPYMDDIRDSLIEVDISLEQDEGKRQYINHICSIRQITDQALEAKIQALYIREILIRALDENKQNTEKLLSLGDVTV